MSTSPITSAPCRSADELGQRHQAPTRPCVLGLNRLLERQAARESNSDFPQLAQVRGRGLMVGVEVDADGLSVS